MSQTHQPGQDVFRSILPEEIDRRPSPAFQGLWQGHRPLVLASDRALPERYRNGGQRSRK